MLFPRYLIHVRITHASSHQCVWVWFINKQKVVCLRREELLSLKNEHMSKAKHLDLVSVWVCSDSGCCTEIQYSLTSTVCIDGHINLLTLTTSFSLYKCVIHKLGACNSLNPHSLTDVYWHVLYSWPAQRAFHLGWWEQLQAPVVPSKSD